MGSLSFILIIYPNVEKHIWQQFLEVKKKNNHEKH